MSKKVEVAKKVIEKYILPRIYGDKIQTFDTRNIAGDELQSIYENGELVFEGDEIESVKGLQIDFSGYYEYIEVIGLTEEEYQELKQSEVCY